MAEAATELLGTAGAMGDTEAYDRQKEMTDREAALREELRTEQPSLSAQAFEQELEKKLAADSTYQACKTQYESMDDLAASAASVASVLQAVKERPTTMTKTEKRRLQNETSNFNDSCL